MLPEGSLAWTLDAGLRAGSPTLPEGSLGSGQGPSHHQRVPWAQSRVPHTSEGSLGSKQGPLHCQRVPWAGCWALSKHPIVLAQEDVPWDSSSGGSQLSPHCARF